MVSTRGPKHHRFEKGEKVLCYEPDPTKAKVLYDSKILGTYETKDKRGRKTLQYKVHFQGWSSSWDRKVNVDFVLKDTEENRRLQRDLAEKAQLQLGSYLYRKDRTRKRKSVTLATLEGSFGSLGGGATTSVTGVVVEYTSPKIRSRVLSEDNFSSSSTFERHDDFSLKDDFETESCCSSMESFPEEERVLLRISERLRQYMEYDHDMIVKYGKQHTLPSRIPAVTILESFVKHTAIKLVCSITQTETTRRRTTQQRTDKKEREFDKLVSTVALLKEVADGLRIYFDFTISEYLLYKEEKDYALSYLSDEYLKSFTYVGATGLDLLHIKPDEQSSHEGASTDITAPSEEPQKRKLRSHRSDDCDLMFENCLYSIGRSTSGGSTPLYLNNISNVKSQQTFKMSPQTRDFLQSLLAWRLLSTHAVPTASMIFGAPHLARLLVKLPEFLNASTITDEKLKILLQHLDSFINFLEAHREWFNEDNYARTRIPTRAVISSEYKCNTKEQQQQHLQQQQQHQQQQHQQQKQQQQHTEITTTIAPTARLAT